MNNNFKGENKMGEVRSSITSGWVEIDATQARGEGERSLTLRGYAALFDTPSERMGALVETIDKRAFDHALSNSPDVRFQAEHTGLALARTTNESLQVYTDDKGLRFEASLNPNVQASRDLYALVKRGDVSQMSFGFTIDEEEVTEEADGSVRAHVTKIGRLFEISSVSFPAYEAASVTAAADKCECVGVCVCDGDEADSDEPAVTDEAAAAQDDLRALELAQLARMRADS